MKAGNKARTTAVGDRFDTLMTRLQAWGVPGLFKRLESIDLLVIDQQLQSALESFNRAKLTCHVLRPADLVEKKAIGRARRIFVFSRTNEWALVRKLRGWYPGKVILSVQYDLGPAGALRPIRRRPLPESNVDKEAAPLVILSSPGSDAEYLIDLLQAGGLGNLPEYLGAPLIDLLPMLKEKFHLPRFLMGAAMRQPERGPFQMLVQTDVLDALYANKALSPERMLKWLNSTKARVIYFLRRDKLMQAGLMAAFADSHHRSVWRVPPGQRQQLGGASIDFAATNRLLNRIMEHEAELEDSLAPFENVKMLTLEDLVERPTDVLKDIGMFIGRPVSIGDDLPSYTGVYHAMPDLLRNVVSFRYELIDRLGLHVNEAGSVLGMSDELFKFGKAQPAERRQLGRKPDTVKNWRKNR